MFQYEFFSLKDFVRRSRPAQPVPECFVTADDLVWIRSSYWAEHCLECGEPLCYETCPNFTPRADGRCRRFGYGIYDNPHFKGFPYAAEISFRKWGKLESIVYPGSYSTARAAEVNALWKKRCTKNCFVMHLGKYGLRKLPIDARRRFDSDKYVFSNDDAIGNPQDTPCFLLQLYSYESEPFTLFFDITDDADLAFREGLTIHPGYNQCCLDVSSLFPPKGKLRAKFYPADNAEVTVVFLFCEFVQLAPGICVQSYPQPLVASVSSDSAAPADKVKCVAWDLDGTVWDGILIESDPDSLALRDGVADTIRELDSRGVLQIVLSKNNRDDVLPVLDRLGLSQYFVHVLADWNPKSANLRRAAKLLNLGINAFALIDDSSFERNEVAYALPMVRAYDQNVVCAGRDGYLLALPEFDMPVTAESRNRRAMYQTEAIRTVAAESAGSNLEFLRSCALTASLSHPQSPDELLRSYELLQRTNQLNLSGSRYEQQAFYDHVHAAECDCFILKCADRFGSYGQVAYLEAFFDSDTATLDIREFAMSCRIAGKFVEAALAKALFSCYADRGIKRIALHGKKTSRNELLLRSFTSVGFDDRSGDDNILLVCDSPSALINADIVSVDIDI